VWVVDKIPGSGFAGVAAGSDCASCTRQAWASSRTTMLKRKAPSLADSIFGRTIDASGSIPSWHGFGTDSTSAWMGMVQFVSHLDVPATNNRIECDVRPVAADRKVTGGTRSARGSKVLGPRMTVTQTLRKTGWSCVAGSARLSRRGSAPRPRRRCLRSRSLRLDREHLSGWLAIAC